MNKLRIFFVSLGAASALFLSGCSQPTPQEKLEEAVVLYQEGDVARAVLKLSDVSKNHADDPAAAEANLILAQHNANIGNGDKSIEFLDIILDKYDAGTIEYETAIEGKIAILAQLGDFETVDEILQEQVDLNEGKHPDRALDYKLKLAQLNLSWPEDEERNQHGHDMLETMMLEDEEAGNRGAARERLADFYRQIRKYEKSNEVYETYLENYPDDPISNQLEFAIALNTYQSGDKEGGLEKAVEIEEAILEEIEAQEEAQKKSDLYRVLAVNYKNMEDFDTAEKYYKESMGQVPMSNNAIRMQFEMAEMFIMGGIQKDEDEVFNRGIEILEQIISENPGTNIALTAEEKITQANQTLDQYRIRRAEYEKYLEEQQAQMEESSAEGGDQMKELVEEAEESMEDALTISTEEVEADLDLDEAIDTEE